MSGRGEHAALLRRTTSRQPTAPAACQLGCSWRVGELCSGVVAPVAGVILEDVTS